MSKKLSDALEICLQHMQDGEPLESTLARYPDLAGQLRPLLETAARAHCTGRESLSQAALLRQRSLGLTLAADLRHGMSRRSLFRRFWRPVVTFLSVAAFLLLSSNGLLLASAHSIPGDTLYPLKRSVESTQLRLVSDSTQRHDLERTFSERRVDETRSLITNKRVENVEFTGVVSIQSANKWLVSNIPVIITSQTDIDAGIRIGDDIEVDGATNTAGDVKAIRLSFASNPDTDDLYPGVTPTPTPSTKTNSGVTPTVESSIPSAKPSVSQSLSVENNNRTGDGKVQSYSGSNDDRSASETAHTSQPDSENGGDY
jgi:hypothetical protein